MTSARYIGPLPIPRGRAALRTYDAYADADRRGFDVAFGGLDQLDQRSVLVRAEKLILVRGDLSEPERHDEVAHQLGHIHRPLRPGQSLQVLEEVVRSDTAQRLIPLPALLCAVATVIVQDGTGEHDPATAAALLLGSQVDIIADRLLALTAAESAAAHDVLSLVKWPPRPVGRRCCVQQHDASASSWLGQIRRRMRWTA
jgi:hypothetical protein